MPYGLFPDLSPALPQTRHQISTIAAAGGGLGRCRHGPISLSSSLGEAGLWNEPANIIGGGSRMKCSPLKLPAQQWPSSATGSLPCSIPASCSRWAAAPANLRRSHGRRLRGLVASSSAGASKRPAAELHQDEPPGERERGEDSSPAESLLAEQAAHQRGKTTALAASRVRGRAP